MSSDTTSGSKPGLSLYANLLEETSPKAPSNTTISGAPVTYKQSPPIGEGRAEDAAAKKQQFNADQFGSRFARFEADIAALRFQPTKRPQVAPVKRSTSAKIGQAPVAQVAPPPDAQSLHTQKTSIAEWTADVGEDDVHYGHSQRQRGGRKRRKKNKDVDSMVQDWDDLYDPSRPNNYEEYKNSEEMFRELREWKDKLHAHRVVRSEDTDSDGEDDRRPAFQFAPPPSAILSQESGPPIPASTEPPADETGEEAFARRMRMSQTASTIANPQSEPSQTSQPTPAQPVKTQTQDSIHMISRAPVRYALPSAPEELPKSEAELEMALEQVDAEALVEDQYVAEGNSIRPGQKGFAERLMAKYGWTKGSGLGAKSTGIITPLQAKLEKQKRKPDSEGGGLSGPSGMGKISGGKRKGGEEEGKFGRMSEVIILRGMVNGMDLQFELGEGNLIQEIGDECGEKYGRVERVFIDQTAPNNPSVFVKFTSQLSALRAVNAVDGRIFNGNQIQARFFDGEKFDLGIYE